MKKSLSWFLFAAILTFPLLCGAQVSVKFKKLEINNITNTRNEPVFQRLGEIVIRSSDVCLKITAEIINDGDTTVYPEERVGLLLSIPGQEPIMSDAPETVCVNGVKLDSDGQVCQNGSYYQLVNNEMVQEYMRENPYLFGSEFSKDILISEFQSNMLFAQRQYALLRLPEMSQSSTIR